MARGFLRLGVCIGLAAVGYLLSRGCVNEGSIIILLSPFRLSEQLLKPVNRSSTQFSLIHVSNVHILINLLTQSKIQYQVKLYRYFNQKTNSRHFLGPQNGSQTYMQSELES